MGRVAVLSTCAMSQRAMDVRGNIARIAESVRRTREAGARYRSGPELDVTGYGCGDHFLEADTLRHAWEGVAWLLQHDHCSSDIMVDVGLPVQHDGVLYNCRLVFLNKKVLLIRPKMMLADDSHMGYQETRWFTPWQKVRKTEDHPLPPCITKVTGQKSAPFGDALLATRDTTIGIEICEELWNPNSLHVGMSLAGAEVIVNGSGSVQMVGHPDNAIQLVKNATSKSGGCYLFANQKGCDGTLGYYPGDACIAVNGRLLGVAALHTLPEVEVVTARVDLDAVLTYRNLIRSRCRVAASVTYPRVQVDFSLCHGGEEADKVPGPGHASLSLPMEPQWPTPAEQVLEGAACWLWDFFRRSDHEGLLLELSGGVSDAATAAVVYTMCCKAVEATQRDAKVRDLLRTLIGTENDSVDARELCGSLLFTYDPRPTSRSALASALAKEIGSNLITSEDLDDPVLKAVSTVEEAMQRQDSGGDGGDTQPGALQHLHALRSCLLSQRVTRTRGTFKWGSGFKFLVLATTPAADPPKAFKGGKSAPFPPEGCGGHFGDVSVVGHIPKDMLPDVLQLAMKKYDLKALGDILAHEAQRSERQGEQQQQQQQQQHQGDLEEEWKEMWSLHVLEHLGPHAMFLTLADRWRAIRSPAEVSKRVQSFFSAQGVGKLTPPGAPSCYVVASGPQQPSRPFLTPDSLTWQFEEMEREVTKLQLESQRGAPSHPQTPTHNISGQHF